MKRPYRLRAPRTVASLAIFGAARRFGKFLDLASFEGRSEPKPGHSPGRTPPELKSLTVGSCLSLPWIRPASSGRRSKGHVPRQGGSKMFARITHYKMKPGSRDAATDLLNSLRDQIMSMPGMPARNAAGSG